MPRDKVELGWRGFWRYVREVLSFAGWPPWWDWASMVVTAVIAAALDDAVSSAWMVPLATALAIGVIGYLGHLIWSAAKLDHKQKRRLHTLAGELTAPEVVQANRDRKHLQRRTLSLFNSWIDFKNAVNRGSEEEMYRAESRLKSAADSVRTMVNSTDSFRGVEYDAALLPVEAILKREDLHPFDKHNPLVPALERLAELEHEDRLWVLRTRTLRRPEDPPPPTPDL